MSEASIQMRDVRDGSLRKPAEASCRGAGGSRLEERLDDLRESPSLKVIEILEARGAQVSYNDPYVPSLRARKLRHYETFELDSVELTEGVVAAADCVLIATDHGAYDYDWIVRSARLVVDTRNATRHVAHHRDKIVKA